MYDVEVYLERTDGLCIVVGCGAERTRKNMCNAHHLRWKRHGTLKRQRKDWSGATREELIQREKDWKRKDYENHRDAYIARAEKWRTENAEHYKKKKRQYLDREDTQLAARKRTRRWVEENPERKREQDKKFAEENRGLVNSYKSARRARMRKAIPPWQTEQDKILIRQIYDECDRISKETGIRHEVDHIVPLWGKVVTGLHVPNNLRIITAKENNRRKRIWNTDAQDCAL
jgi:hypothetical protein